MQNCKEENISIQHIRDLYPGLGMVIQARDTAERQKGTRIGKGEMRMAERNIGLYIYCSLES